MAASNEPTVAPNAPMPPGYTFVRKGTTYITANCRKQTQAANKPVYVVVDPAKKQQTGIRVPQAIYNAVREAEQATRSTRAAAVDRKDAGLARKFEVAVLRLFPKVPTEVAASIVKHAMVKRSKRVARVGAMEESKRARLAVWAHVRHCCTDYDKLLRQGVPREEARNQVKGKMEEVIREWRGNEKGKAKKGTKGPGRPTRRASVDSLAKTKNILSPRKKRLPKLKSAKGAGRIDKAKNGRVSGPRTSSKTAAARVLTARATRRVEHDELADFIVISSDSETMFDDDDAEESDWTPDAI